MQKKSFLIKFLIISFIGLLVGCSSKIDEVANKKIVVNLRLNENSIDVNISNLSINSDTVVLSFPKTISGTYHYIENKNISSDILAVDSLNSLLLVKQLTSNKYKIIGAKSLKSIRYSLKSSKYNSFNVISKGAYIDKKLAVLNSNILLPVISGNDKRPISINIHKDKLLNNISNQNLQIKNDTTECLSFNNYDEFLNSPIVYSANSSKQILNIDSCSLEVAVHSPNNRISANDIMKIIEPTAKAVLKELHFLKQKKYNLAFIFNDKLDSGLFNIALEHSQSSIYHLFSEPDFSNEKDSLRFVKMIKHYVAHEMFHLFTPLNFKDEKMANILSDDFKMSQHLWLYEGFVEYFSAKILYKNATISEKDFFEFISNKMFESRAIYKSGFKKSLAKYSKYIYKYPENLGTFYSKGAIIAFSLDIHIAKTTNGKYDLFDVLKKIYSTNKVFKSDSLFDNISKIVGGDTKGFINKYIIGMEFPDDSFFQKAGISHEFVFNKSGHYFPVNIIRKNLNRESVFIEYSMKNFSKKTIELAEIDGCPVSLYVFSKIYHQYFKNKRSVKIKYFDGDLIKEGKLETVYWKRWPKPKVWNFTQMRSMNKDQKLVHDKLFSN